MAEPSSPDDDFVPYIPASQSLPEITLKAVVLGFVLSAVLAGANAYLGLKVGMTVSASIPAAVISMAVLRFFRQHNILENNIVQTAASAGESVAAGVIFTLPALIMLGYWDEFAFWPTMAIATAGGILGVLFTIPLRRALVIEAKLQFPEGVATGEVLKAGERGGEGAKLIGIAGLAGATLKLLQSGLKVVSGKMSVAATSGGAVFGFGSELGVALLGVGFIIGLNIATLVFAGGLISWLIGIPLFTAFAAPETLEAITGGASGYPAAEEVWNAQIRFMGVGAMAAGGLWTLVALMGPIRDGVASSFDALRRARAGGDAAIPRTERDMPINMVIYGTLGMALPILGVFLFVVDQDALGITSGSYYATIGFGVVFALVAGFLFSSVAGYMAGLVGSSNNPISGVTIATILTISLLLLAILGSQIDFAVDAARATAAAATAILVGGVVACAAAIAGDNLQDLKAGHIVGATPRNQQIMQIVGVLAGAIAIAPVLQLLFSAYGLGDVFPRAGMNPAEALSAPQATLMSSVAHGVFVRDLPWTMIWIGVGIAAVLIALDKVLEARGSSFRTPVLAVAVGIYLPIELTTPIFVGGGLAWAAARAIRRSGGDQDAVTAGTHRGLLFASGLITGEALIGIVLAIPFAAAQSTDVLTVPLGGLGWIVPPLGVFGFVMFCFWLYRVARRPAA
jgi:putative OPT family oligopeptide transporter